MNPSTGTFISMDSYQGSIYDPVTLHKYLYANANPVMYTDPSGYSSTLQENLVSVGIAGIIVAGFAFANQTSLNIFSSLRRDLSDAIASDIVWATQRDWQSVILTFPSHNYDKSWIISVPATLLSWKLFEAIYATEEDVRKIPGVPAEEKEDVKIIQDKKTDDSTISDKSKELWGKGTFDSVEESLKYHYKEHGKSVNAESIDEYVRKAEGFSQNLRGAKKSYPKGGTPGAIRYTKNGKYIIIGPDGRILSYGLAR